MWEQQKACTRAEPSLWTERARVANQVGSISKDSRLAEPGAGTAEDATGQD